MFFKLPTAPKLLVLIVASTTCSAWAGTVTTEGEDLVINTKGGLEIKTVDDEFKFNIGGKIQYDVTSFRGLSAASQNKHFASSSDAFVRRGQLSLEGAAFTDWLYGIRFSYDGTEGNTDVDRVWVARDNIFDFAKVTIGKYKVNYGLDNATSSSWITAMERPAMYDFLSGSDDTDFGINISHAGDNYSLMAQVATAGDKPNDGNNDIYGYTLRATWAPILQPNQILHLGANYHDANPDHNETQLRSRFGIRSDADDRMRFAEITDTTKDHEYALEAAYQLGSLRLQSEYYARQIRGDNDGEAAKADVNGFYTQLSYLFGTSRGYDAGEGKWKKPRDFNSWEIFARYENTVIDANKTATKKNINNNIDGIFALNRGDKHDVDAFTLGVNYFPNENIRASLNYITYEISNIDTSESIDGRQVKDDSNAIVARLQFAF
ncbi:porin [Pectobacterium cacticida]|uniref:Porin n=1 Tax=Pectobacterium cacticida TaxID=69221 RepID=A0ABZ2GAL0_9GAMM|nr:porin [Pectobacterium cacticida]UYX06743.1 porin [Pectobacterium cacticida]